MDTEHTEIEELVPFKRLNANAPSGSKLLEFGATGYEPKSSLLDGCATKVDFGEPRVRHHLVEPAERKFFIDNLLVRIH